MNRRRALLQALAVGLVAAPAAAWAQRPRMARVGVLSSGSPGPSPLLRAFQDALRDLGHVEGESVTLELRFASGRVERLSALAAELVGRKVDVIMAINTTAARAALNATKTIPIVFTWVADPAVLVPNLGRPTGNITGLSSSAVELSAKRLELVKTALPGLARVGVLWNPAVPAANQIVREMEAAGPQLAVRVHRLALSSEGDLHDVFRAAVNERVSAVVVIEEATLIAHRERILGLAQQHRLPVASQYRGFAEAGALLSYGSDLPDLFRRAAEYVHKILGGARPADLPVQEPTKFELVVNLKTARALGLTIPPSVLVRADHVIG
jgi:putative ABC transport system substrate-binding protein